ncbi:MAG: asparagine synthase (glutamine-hydrolyzing) [Anaerolineae bacterium]|nr:asparagine synthase (glutamine-hydrolyzing) [Anaerolineae bacterium]
MCGICGKLHFDSNNPVDESLIYRMNKVLDHRGPDDEGVYVNHNVGLGQKRLAIIDLSPHGHQPMPNEHKTVWIVFNGEIYNFLELRPILERKGHRFSSQTDTEVVIHLYEEYGADCVKYLRGTFAFALWDANRQRLLLGRDRIGQKPLCYAIVNDGLIFASEIKAILQDPAVKREVDPIAVHYYLTYGYVPVSQCAFTGVKKVPPAHILIWEKGKINVERYWELSYAQKIDLTEEETCEHLLELLRECTEIRLVSDVSLGAFLSGGIDSSSVVAMMSQLSDEPVKTYSVGFEDQSFNELQYARIVAQLYNTDHHEIIVKPNALEVLPKLVWHYDEPYADSSAVPTYYVAKATREHVTVALNGDGGDESFAGYPRYVERQRLEHIIQYVQMMPEGLRKTVVASLSKLAPEQISRNVFLRRLRWLLNNASATPAERYGCFMTIFHNEMREQLYSADFSNAVAHVDPARLQLDYFDHTDALDMTEKAIYADIMTYLPGDLLAKMDIASAVVSLESRSPYLDHRMLEFAARLPVDYKLRGDITKYILKKALSGLLPDDVLHRRKMGFGVPLGRWFRQELKEYAYQVLLDNVSISRGYFSSTYVKALLDDHMVGRGDNSRRMWALLNLELWHRMFIDQKPPDTAP